MKNKSHHHDHDIHRSHGAESRESDKPDHSEHTKLIEASHRAHEEHAGHDKHAGHSVEMFSKKFWLTLILSVPTLFWSQELQHWFGYSAPVFPGALWIPPVFGAAVYFYGGWVFLHGAWREIVNRLPGMMTLISLAITVAFLFSAAVTLGFEGHPLWWELATLVTIMLLGHWIEMRSIFQAHGALKELAKLLPDTAVRIGDNDQTEEVPVSQLREGDLLLIRPGAGIPADGIVQSGKSSVNEAMITGESKPVSKRQGEKLIAGTINGEGSLRIQVTGTGEKTALAGIMRLVEQAQSSRSRAQALADRAAFFLTLVAIGAGAITLIAWLAFGAALDFTITRVVTVLVIACPHALGLAIPLVISISTTLGARNGLLVRDRRGLEEARNLNSVVFDKTGTLTLGEHRVGGPNFLTMKCDSSGTILWTRQYNGPDNGFDRGYAIAVDHSGDLYATGAVGYGQNVQDIFTIKYTSSGDSVWSARYNGPASGRDFPYGTVVDGTGNVYVTGSAEAGASLSDFVTIKYNASGVQQWVAVYNGPGNAGDIAAAVALDPAGRLIVTGQVFGGASSTDFATIEYNPLTGDTVQVLRYAGAGSSADVPVAMAIDRTSNIYITGFTGVLNSADLITVKYQRGTTGLNESVELHPRTATLFQNYPNPFNPTTRIKFTLSSQERDGVRSPVTLKVYDILGREVRTLVNENLQAGSYEVTFDAEGLASGVYFYRLETGVFIETKRLVLLR